MTKEFGPSNKSKKRWHSETNLKYKIYFSIMSSMLGGMFGGIVFTWGFGVLAMLLDLATPFQPVGRYGQFQFVVIIFGAFGIVGGVSCGLIPWVGNFCWAVTYSLVMISLLAFVYEAKPSEFLENISLAFLISCLFFVVFAPFSLSFLKSFLRS